MTSTNEYRNTYDPSRVSQRYGRRNLTLLCAGLMVAAIGCAPQGEPAAAEPDDEIAIPSPEDTPEVQSPVVSNAAVPAVPTGRVSAAVAEPDPVATPQEGVSGTVSGGIQDAIADALPPSALIEPADEAVTRTYLIPAETPLVVNLIDSISTARNRPGDRFMASLAEPIAVDGATVLDRGVIVRGRVVEVSRPGRLQGRALISTVLTHIEGAGEPIDIATLPFTEEAQQNLGRDATLGGLGAAAGAAIGAVTGGGRGAAIGAAAGGLGTIAVTRGDELEYPSETRIQYQLESEVPVPRIEVASGEGIQ